MTVKSKPTRVKQNATLIDNGPSKPWPNNNPVTIFDKRVILISVKKGQQNVCHPINWASKNRLALLSDINPQSHWDDQVVPTVPKKHVNCNTSKNTAHKVGTRCVDPQAVIPCIITPDTDTKVTCTVKITHNKNPVMYRTNMS